MGVLGLMGNPSYKAFFWWVAPGHLPGFSGRVPYLTPNATRRTELALMVAFATSSPEISCFKSHAMRCDAMRIPEFPGTMVAKATVILLVVSMQPYTKVTTN